MNQHPTMTGLGPPSGKLVVLVIVTAFSLLQVASADQLDIKVELYPDSGCIERIQDLFLLDEGCYANTYSNLSKAFMLKMVGFGSPEKFNLFEYTGTCDQEFARSALPREITSQRCTRFVGPYYAMVRSAFRSSSCTGSDCSTLHVGIQSFYPEVRCGGLPSLTFKFPLQNACVRWYNGTRTLQVDATFSTITQVDYVENDFCNGGSRVTYTINVSRGHCYELYTDKEPRSFQWIVEASNPTISAVSAAPRRHLPGGASLLAALALAAYSRMHPR